MKLVKLGNYWVNLSAILYVSISNDGSQDESFASVYVCFSGSGTSLAGTEAVEFLKLLEAQTTE